MTDEASTVAEAKTQCHENGLPRPTCWVGSDVSICTILKYELLRNRLAMCGL